MSLIEEAPPEAIEYTITLKSGETITASGLLDFNPYFAAILDVNQPGKSGNSFRASHIFNWSEVKSIITPTSGEDVPF